MSTLGLLSVYRITETSVCVSVQVNCGLYCGVRETVTSRSLVRTLQCLRVKGLLKQTVYSLLFVRSDYNINAPVSVSTETLKMEGSEEVIVRDILRQSLNGSSDCSPLSRVTAPLTWRRREREELMAASTLEGRNTMSEGDTTNTCRENKYNFQFQYEHYLYPEYRLLVWTG